MPPKGEGEDPPNTGFQFVAEDPSSGKITSNNLHKVRSHAGKWIWRQLRHGRDNANTRPGRNHLDSDSAVSDTHRIPEMSEPKESRPFELPCTSSAAQSSKIQTLEDDCIENPQINMEPSTPRTDSISGILDPFQSHISPSPLSDELVSHSMQYCRPGLPTLPNLVH
jgi:hypothetical protein